MRSEEFWQEDVKQALSEVAESLAGTLQRYEAMEHADDATHAQLLEQERASIEHLRQRRDFWMQKWGRA